MTRRPSHLRAEAAALCSTLCVLQTARMRDDGAGGRTPLRDTAWGAQTPAYDTSHWNDDTPTPGGESGYTGTPDVRHTGTPDLRGGSSALAISASDAGYRGKFITGAVVVLPGGKQGVVRSRSGDEVTVQIGTLKTLPNGETRMESSWKPLAGRAT